MGAIILVEYDAFESCSNELSFIIYLPFFLLSTDQYKLIHTLAIIETKKVK